MSSDGKGEDGINVEFGWVWEKFKGKNLVGCFRYIEFRVESYDSIV